MIQWLLARTIQFAQYAQGVGAANARTDQAVLRRLKRHNPAARVIFDVGANCGNYTQLALKEGASSPVIHAFEPSATAFKELAKRFEGNPQVFLNNTALGSEAGESVLYSDSPGSELSSLYPRLVGHHGIKMTGNERVRVETLDAYCANHNVPQIDLLKLDVEGHELAVLRGANQLLANGQVKLVSFEFGGCNIDSRTYLRDFVHFFQAHQMELARVTVFGKFEPILRYHEGWEQFRTTCFVAYRAGKVAENSA